MTITQIASQVLADHSAVQIRYRSGAKGEPKEYDCKPLFTGSHRGWIVLDAMTANAIMTVHRSLREDLRYKMDIFPLKQLVDFCWRMVA